MIKTQLEKIIIKALGELGIKTDSVHLEHPVDFDLGDYSTNVAMVYSKQLKTNPKELAEKIVEKIPVTGLLGKVEVAGAGFINFYLSQNFFENSVSEILKAGERYGSNEILKDKKILIEHSSPNLFKEFHIGHMVNNSIGESITRIIKNSRANTKVISYPSDVGLGIAKTIGNIFYNDVLPPNPFFADYTKMLKEGKIEETLVKRDGEEFLSRCINIIGGHYQIGNGRYKDEENFRIKVDEINKKIYNKSDQEINKIYEFGKKLTLEYFEQIVARLGSKFNNYIFESEAAEVGKKIVEENTPKVFEKSEGAIVFKGKNFDENLHTRVFLNSAGLTTYEAKDIGLLKLKFEKFRKFGIFGFHPKLSVFVTDHEQGEYMKVVLEAAKQVGLEGANKTKHIVHGRLRFPEGRLSSREGNVIPANVLINQVKEDVLKKIKESGRVDNIDKTAEEIAVGAIKYSILKSSAGKNIMFDVEKDLALEGNTGPYLQYTYARAKSVLEKAESENIKTWELSSQVQKSGVLDNPPGEVEKLLYRFPEIVERAGDEYEPHYIATYLFELAQTFNSFYGNNKIADNTDENAPYKVALTKAVAQTIKNGLYLLGIEAPERL